MAGILFDRQCAIAAKRNLNPDMFNRPFEEVYRILWATAVEHLAAYNKLPTNAGLLTGLRTAIERNSSLLPMEQQMMHTLFSLNEMGDRHTVDRTVVTRALIPRFLADRYIRPMAASMDLANPDKVRELNNAVASMQTAKSPRANVFDFDTQTAVLPNPGRATGFEFFDMMTTRTAADPGGLRKRNTLGVLGGFGCVREGTPIDTPDGPVNVEDFKGGPVISFDGNGRCVRNASASFIKGEDMFYEVRFYGGRFMRVTSEHRFLTTKEGYLTVGDIMVRNKPPLIRALKLNGTKGHAAIHSIRKMNVALVYDLSVEGTECYASNGIISHNSGKTLFGIETQCKAALNGLRSVNFHYEQSVEEDLRARFWANITGISSAEFASKPNYLDHPPEVREQLDACRPLMDLAEVCDMRATNGQGTGGVQDLVSYLLDYRERVGENPAVVVIDYLERLVQQWAGKDVYGMDSAGLLRAYEMTMEGLVYEVAHQFDTQVVILNQLNTEAGSKGVTYRPTEYEAMGFKSFAKKLDYCLVLTRPDHNGLRWGYGAKARGEKSEVILSADNYRARLNVEKGKYTISSMSGKPFFLKLGDDD